MQVSQRAPRERSTSRAQPTVAKPVAPGAGWFARLLGAFGAPPAEQVDIADNSSGLLAFPSEAAPPSKRTFCTLPCEVNSISAPLDRTSDDPSGLLSSDNAINDSLTATDTVLHGLAGSKLGIDADLWSTTQSSCATRQ